MLQIPSSVLLFCLLISQSVAQQSDTDAASRKACQALDDIFPGRVNFPGSANYTNDIAHYTPSSSQNSTCSIEPTNNEDVSKILNIIGREDIRAPFAVKSGGHTTNRDFSSTTGVQISLSQFNEVTYDASAGTVRLGPGLTWDEVYPQLDPLNVTVAGGRVPGVGVGGLLLGGGYSWIVDEVGLSIDTILSYDLILPNGTFVEVTNSSHPDLFFALKGSGNNFGIVTSFTLRAFPNNGVWGGAVVFSLDVIDLVFDAVANYSQHSNDSKAQISLVYVIQDGQTGLQLILFYNAPEQPAVFDELLAIPSILNTAKSNSLNDFITSTFGATASLGPGDRAKSNGVPIVHYTVPVLNAIKMQVDTIYAQAVADNRSVTALGFNCEPLIHPFDHSTPSAYPHPSSRQVTPGNPGISWSDPADDDYVNMAIRKLSDGVQTVAIQEGESRADDIVYSNYAVADTPLELIYGDNIGRLREIKNVVDPTGIMGLSGGFKI